MNCTSLAKAIPPASRYKKGGDPKVKDRLKGYLSFFIMPGKSRRVRVMDFFWGGWRTIQIINGYPAENKRDNRCFYGKR